MSGTQCKDPTQRDNGNGTAYSLPHNDSERHRLAIQHKLLYRTWGHKILIAPVGLTNEDWVLDSGTGTGIWLRDLARETSAHSSYVGVDITSALFPDPSTVPGNMWFEQQSIVNLPVEWTGKFTLVHQRLLIAGLRQREWAQAVREMYRVLKPGGWVQLLELETWTSGHALAQHREMLYKFSDEQGTMWRDITKKIPGMLKASGFTNLHSETRWTPCGKWAGKDGIDGRENLMGLMKGLKASLLKGGGYGVVKTEAEYDELVEQIRQQMDSIPGSGSDWVMFWAQKPEVAFPKAML